MKRKGAKRAKNPKVRVYVVIGFFFLLFAAVFARAFELQVLKSRSLKQMAARQHRKTLNIQSKRGDIYDRNQKEMAVSIEVDSVFAQPSKIDSPRATAKFLAPILSEDRIELERKLKSANNFVWLKRQVDLKDGQRKAIAGIDGIGVMKESRRYYPNKALASNIIGFTGLDSSGLEGVEARYDSMLRGAPAKYVGDKDAMGRMLVFEDFRKTVSVQGMEVALTIDKTIQYVAEKALKKAVDDSGAKGGMALVMNPMTGEMLAMASYPTFDPNDFGAANPKQWRNRAMADAFEPGSVMKLFLISAALEENAIRTTDNFFCENGSYHVADRVFHDHEKYGWLTVPQIIKYSSNICSAKIGERLGKAQVHRYLKAFGFGSRTGVDLPGEASGSLRNVNSWSGVTLETVSFGQGISVTGLQLVTALSAVANGGFLMKPYVVKSIKDPNGKVVSETYPVIVKRIVSEETAKKMTNMLIGVTQTGGTGVKAAMDDFEVAGKTGTAQKPDPKKGGYLEGAFTASFFGFVPARSPRLSILVAIDEPKKDHYGGTVAGPAFKEIAEKSLSYMGVFKERQNLPNIQLVKADTVEESKKEENLRPMAVPDFTGKTVRAVLRLAKGRSFDVDIMGSGRAVSQKPVPGSNVPAKGPVVVFFQ
ncbi:MAG: PASTA domain-containing protein [Deltaproteobacteria bacterium]|nr:PASTA domain-containing protein [Deltaproteobacteria bacterium]